MLTSLSLKGKKKRTLTGPNETQRQFKKKTEYYVYNKT